MGGWWKAILLALLLELTLCQYSSWMTAFNQPKEAENINIYAGGQWNEDGTLTVEDSLRLEISEINCEVNALKVRFTRMNADGVEKEPVTTVSVYARDEANEDYYVLPDRQILKDVSKSQYMKLHLSGDCKSLVISFAAPQGNIIRIDEILINPRIPVSFSPLRLVLLTLTIFFICAARVRGRHYAVMWSENSRLQKTVTLGVILLQIGLFAGTVFLNPVFSNVEWEHHMQYHRLAEALSQGRLYLEEQPPAFLSSMENPYDFVMRDKMAESAGESYLWDVAYFEGKYYVYFGVVPVILFYLPWYLATGTPFPTHLGILITGIGFILAAFWLSGNLVRKYFKKGVPYLGWLLGTLLMINGCGALTIMRRPDFYSLPILLAVTLSVFGIGCFISSLSENQVTAWKLVAGALSMALVAGCRPQLLLGSLLAIPIFWDAVFQKSLLFSKNSRGRTALAMLAYGVVGAFLMFYNFKRFGSPFDFGATYNLTTNDMTRRGFELGRLPQAFFLYLLQPPALSARFPYLQLTSQWTSYMGKAITEGTFGGFLPANLMAASSLWFLGRKKWFSSRTLYWTAALAAVLGILVVCIDAQAAGVLLRYFSDFGWLFYLTALIAWFAAWEHNRGSFDRTILLRLGMNAAFAATMAFSLLLLFTDNSDALVNTAPDVFYRFYYELAFWV